MVGSKTGGPACMVMMHAGGCYWTVRHWGVSWISLIRAYIHNSNQARSEHGMVGVGGLWFQQQRYSLRTTRAWSSSAWLVKQSFCFTTTS
jgi:hypothetical protein